MKNSLYRNPLDWHSQAGQDVIENGTNGYRTGGFGLSSGKAYSKIDEFEKALREQGLMVDVVSYDSERNLVSIKSSDYPTALIATKFFKDKGFKVNKL